MGVGVGVCVGVVVCVHLCACACMCLHDIVSSFALLGAAVITSFSRNRRNISSLYLREQWHSQWPGSLKTHTEGQGGREGETGVGKEGRRISS